MKQVQIRVLSPNVQFSHFRAAYFLKLTHLTSKQAFLVQKAALKKILVWLYGKKCKEINVIQPTQEFTTYFLR